MGWERDGGEVAVGVVGLKCQSSGVVRLLKVVEDAGSMGVWHEVPMARR